jgi:hypothetical protein
MSSSFEGREPAFRNGIVPALSDMGEGLDDAVFVEEPAERGRGVLSALPGRSFAWTPSI